MHEDFLCPACRRFEQTHGKRIVDAVVSGEVRVRYHPLNMLDRRSDPPDYSLRAANAALVVADVAPTRFLDFHRGLSPHNPRRGLAATIPTGCWISLEICESPRLG